MKRIIIAIDYRDVSYSYQEVKEAMGEGKKEIKTHCLDFFNFRTLQNGYDVIIMKRNGDYISLSELMLDDDNLYTTRQIREGHNVHKLFVSGEFQFKRKEVV